VVNFDTGFLFSGGFFIVGNYIMNKVFRLQDDLRSRKEDDKMDYYSCKN